MPKIQKKILDRKYFVRCRMCTYVDNGLIFTYNKQNCNIKSSLILFIVCMESDKTISVTLQTSYTLHAMHLTLDFPLQPLRRQRMACLHSIISGRCFGEIFLIDRSGTGTTLQRFFGGSSSIASLSSLSCIAMNVL